MFSLLHLKKFIWVVKNEGLSEALKKTWRYFKGKGYIKLPRLSVAEKNTQQLAFISLAHIKKALANPSVRMISFDIFDTLLIRPALQPRDIFHILAKKVDKVYGVDFVRMRWDAESALANPNATIQEIYEFISFKYHLPADTAEALMKEEIHCETTLLSPRQDVKTLYDEAVRLGKRVIAISDMYLPGGILADILQKKGLPVEKVYVSCDYAARKSDGALYDVVLRGEGVHPSEILHIGDNWQSDYMQALRKKLTAVWLPSVAAMCFGNNQACESLFKEAVLKDPLLSIFLGFSLNRLYGKWDDFPKNIAAFKNLRHFSELVLAPLLTAFGIFLSIDKTILSSYSKIYFASRDGWLPKAVYDCIRNVLGGLPSVYFSAGRRAYYPFLYGSFLEYLEKMPVPADPDNYTLHDLITAYFSDTQLLLFLEQNLRDDEKELLFFHEKKNSLNILRRFEREIENGMKEKCKSIKAYYQNVFCASEKRYLIFDVGYSGSVGYALTAILGKPADKVYFWEDNLNKKRDKALGTVTRTFFKSGVHAPLNLILEELFSCAEGGCIGFDRDAKPITEKIFISKDHECDIAEVHAACIDYAKGFCATLGEYAVHTVPNEPDTIMSICRALLQDFSFCNLSIFKNIVFPDPVYRSHAASLEKKIEEFLPRETTLAGTGFDDIRNVFHVSLKARFERKVGIHLHLYNIPQAHEIVRYLQGFPVPFDLYVTITDSTYERTLQNLFSQSFLPNRRLLHLLEVKNRGRDVAPWLLNTRQYQASYDLFCHIHSKASAYNGYGDEWRRYLFDNLISADAVTDILNVFEEHPMMGCVFPAMFSKLRQSFVDLSVPVYGSNHEYELICNILSRMGMRDEVCLSEFFFSGGTMMWYRPDALRQMFTVDLHLDEFAKEPIGVGGTLAHALERIPSIVALRNGYMVKSITRYPG